MFADFGPKSTKFGQDSPEFWQASAEFGPNLSNDRRRPMFDVWPSSTNLADVGPKLVEIAPKLAELGQIRSSSARIGRNLAELGQNLPNLAKHWTQVWSKFGRSLPKFEPAKSQSFPPTAPASDPPAAPHHAPVDTRAIQHTHSPNNASTRPGYAVVEPP